MQQDGANKMKTLAESLKAIEANKTELDRAWDAGFNWYARTDPRQPQGWVGPHYFDKDGKAVTASQLTDLERQYFFMGLEEAKKAEKEGDL
jgi:hypothetical protein